MPKRRRQLKGPARAYRNSPKRYEAVRGSPFSMRAIDDATKLGCRDAVSSRGRKNVHKPEAGGFVTAYREGYRICDAIHNTGRVLSADERRVRDKLKLESEIQFSPLGGTRRKRRR